VLCKERVGSCIQCSVKTCKTAYHVTCAFKRGLEMRAIIEDENAEDGVKLRVMSTHVVSSLHRRLIFPSFSVVLSKAQPKSKEERF
jgi:hypothetical protein